MSDDRRDRERTATWLWGDRVRWQKPTRAWVDRGERPDLFPDAERIAELVASIREPLEEQLRQALTMPTLDEAEASATLASALATLRRPLDDDDRKAQCERAMRAIDALKTHSGRARADELKSVRAEARRETLEEAAGECDIVLGIMAVEADDGFATTAAEMCAGRIRALAAKGTK